ncbi:MAG: serine/threonine-protein kinase [Planctomycetota bacterium]|nr:serine/threonine-protein kinase [Planctomycetota bacterium]
MGKTDLNLFRRSAILSGLLTETQFDHAQATLQKNAELAGDDPKRFVENNLISFLTEQNLVSNYQANQLVTGRTKFNLGPYIITDWIGQGGMGQVFKAVHEVMGRESAVKVLPLTKSTPYAIDNFQREIRTQAQLDHPNLVRAYDAGHDGNVHYLVTEYVPGTDLRKLVRSQGALSMPQAASIIVQAAQGLDHAHQRGLIHRDIKPGNILVTPEGTAKVSDLGLSGFIHRTDDDPRAGKIVGTADYLSPEQIHSPNKVTSVADIYSLGCTLYYAVTGKVPFPGGKTREKAQRHLNEQPWHPKRFNGDLSEDFVETIADMMEKNPEKRVPTAAEVANRLEPWLEARTSMPAYPMTKSPWSLPPMPLEKDDAHDTAPGFDSGYEQSQDSNRYQSSGEVDGESRQDTGTNEMGSTIPPPLVLSSTPLPARSGRWPTVFMVLASMGLGLAAGYFLGKL